MKKIFLFLALGLICMTGTTGCDEENKEPGNVPLTGILTDRDDGGISLNVRYSEAIDNVKYYPVPANATDVNFKVTSQDQSVATIQEIALGQAQITVLKPGSTVITISSGDVIREIPVTGRFDVTALDEIRLELDIEPQSGTDSTMVFSVSVGDIIQVKASANPRNANTETHDYVRFNWESDNSSVATVVPDETTETAVDKTGQIIVTGAGEAKITISSDDVSDERKPLKAKYIIIKSD